MAIYETHCHLNHERFADDFDQSIQRALDENIRRLLVVSYDLESSRRAANLSQSYEPLRSAIGVHPEDAGQWSDETRDQLLALHSNPSSKVVAWGEIGLDYHWRTFTDEFQKSVFTEQLKLARSLNLPVVIHCREAYDDTLDLLESFGSIAGVVHCFTGTVEQAQRAVSLGFHIGVGGVVTYKNAQDVRSIVEQIPLNRILLETDSPFLTPQPWRGKRNEPAYILAVVEKVAELLAIPPEDVEAATWDNAAALFGS